MTHILGAANDGDSKRAEKLFPLVYDELRRLAVAKMAREKPGHTLQATALVHEVWLRLSREKKCEWESQRQFLAAAAEAMRRILIESSRRKARPRHGGDLQRIDVEGIDIAAGSTEEKMLAVHEALDELERDAPEKAELVKLKYFVGLTNREVAEALDLSVATVERRWAYSKAWIADFLNSK